jgi:RNA polymerase primary sigma factor
MVRRYDSSRTFDLNVYFKEIDKYKLLNAEEEAALAVRVMKGDAVARDTLVKHNLRLVVNVARNYHRPGRSMGDLIEEGNLGLIHAAGMYNPDHQTRFSTYATHWIRQSIRHFNKTAQWPMRIPAYMHTLIGKLKKAGVTEPAQLDTREGRETLIKIRKVGNVDRAVYQAKKAMSAFGLSILETPDNDMTPDLTTKGEVENALLNEEQSILKDAIINLDERERQVITMRFGLDDGKSKTLREVGERLSLTRERIRQIEREALIKLRDRLCPDEEIDD